MRRLAFQVHLWTGVILAVYMVGIGLTGAVLVFHDELERAANPWPWKAAAGGRADIAAVIRNVQSSYPRWRLTALEAPSEHRPGFVAILQNKTRLSVASDESTGRVLGVLPPGPPWLRFIRELHETLLIGRQGRIVNGVGGACLLGMCLSGVMIWWRRRSMWVDWRRSWKRINFDLHSAAGFWALLLIAFWGASAMYSPGRRRPSRW